MHNALLVRGFERLRNLTSIIQRCLNWKRAGEILALNQFNHQEVWPDVVEVADIGVVERRNHSRFPFETHAELCHADLDCEDALQASVTCLIHLTHATITDMSYHLL